MPSHRPHQQSLYASNLGGTSMRMAIREPIPFREGLHVGRVGDVGFFDSEGEYQWVCNAFDTAHLAVWNWPSYAVPESVAVTEENPPHFRFLVGGSFKTEKLDINLVGETGVAPGVDAGGSVKLQFSCTNESMSALVPGQDSLKRRICLGARAQELRAWFGAVEANAWAYVAAANQVRPEKIFLVASQTLTSEYFITHDSSGSSTCNIEVSVSSEVPLFGQGKVLTGYTCESVKASAGFQLVKKKCGNEMHSIFFKVYESRPTSFIRKASLIQRLLQVHRGFMKLGTAEEASRVRSLAFLQWPDQSTASHGKGSSKPMEPTQKAPMQQGDECCWYLLKSGESEFAVQYTGPDPDRVFPVDLDDDELMNIVEELYVKAFEGNKHEPEAVYFDDANPMSLGSATSTFTTFGHTQYPQTTQTPLVMTKRYLSPMHPQPSQLILDDNGMLTINQPQNLGCAVTPRIPRDYMGNKNEGSQTSENRLMKQFRKLKGIITLTGCRGNNFNFGNNGKLRCVHCRKAKQSCDYPPDDDRPCYSREKGLVCCDMIMSTQHKERMKESRRTLDNEAAAANSEKWQLDSPILPKILEKFDPEEQANAFRRLCLDIEQFRLTSGSPMISSPAPATSESSDHDVKNLDLIMYPHDTGGYASTSEHVHLKQEDSPFQGNFTAATTGIPQILRFYDESPTFNQARNSFAEQSSYFQPVNGKSNIRVPKPGFDSTSFLRS